MSLRSRWKFVVVACATGFLVSLVGFVWLLFSPVSVNAWITSHWIIAPSRAGGIAFLSRANEPQGVVSLLCTQCGYSLASVPARVCSECGSVA